LPDDLVVANFKVSDEIKEDCKEAAGSDQAYYSGDEVSADEFNEDFPDDEVPYDVAFTEPVPVPRKKQVP